MTLALSIGPVLTRMTRASMLDMMSRNYMQRVPMLLVWPSLATALAIGAFNTLGDGLRDALDPRLAGGRRRWQR